MRKIIFLLFVLVFFSNSYGGWFICYSYKGLIGKDSVVFYMQLSRHWSDMKNKDLPVYAVYMNPKNNEPISLEGVWVRSNQHIRLAHMNKFGKPTENMEFVFSAPNQLNGVLTNTNEKKIVSLVNTGNMIDTSYIVSTVKPIAILMDTSLPNAYLIGDYSLDPSSGSDRASMRNLKIINKQTNRLIQQLDFSGLDFECGNVITILFKNVKLMDYNKDGYPDLEIWKDRGKMGSAFYALYDPKKKQFVMHPEIITH